MGAASAQKSIYKTYKIAPQKKEGELLPGLIKLNFILIILREKISGWLLTKLLLSVKT